MSTEIITEKIQRFKNYSTILYREGARVYVQDLNEEYYFGDIVSIQPEYIEIVCFAPVKKQGKKIRIEWIKIIKLDKYRERFDEDEI
jgi:hypothetical protein